MRRTSLVLLVLAACGSTTAAPRPSTAATVSWQDVITASGDARDPAACRAPDHDFGAPLQTFSEHQVHLKRRPDDAETARAAREAGRRMQREGVSLNEVALGDALVASAEAQLAAIGEPIPPDPAPPLLGALAAELLCDLAAVEQMHDDPDYADAPAVVERELENTRRLALAYFTEARAAGDDPAALERLVAPAEARAAASTPATAMVLEKVAARYADLARDRAAARR